MREAMYVLVQKRDQLTAFIAIIIMVWSWPGDQPISVTHHNTCGGSCNCKSNL